MGIEFQYEYLNFPPVKGREETRKATFNFKGVVQNVAFAINGYKLEFTEKDHHVAAIVVNIEEGSQEINGSSVEVPVTIGLRDKGGYDDEYEGKVHVLAIAVVDD